MHILATDGHIVPATFASAGSERIVILSHGMTAGKDEEGVHSDFAEMLLERGMDSVRFDFRGHGESAIPSRNATIAGRILDFMAVVDWVRRRDYKQIFHVATSFGASITLLCAGRFSFSDFSAVAFWNPVIDYDHTFISPRTEWAKRYFDHESVEEFARRAGFPLSNNIVVGPGMAVELLFLRPQDTVWPPNLPLLIIHGDRDTCVPYEDALDFRERNRHVTRLHTLPGTDHGFGGKLSQAFETTVAFFSY